MSWEGALILYHIEGTNKFLLGNESLYIWEKTGNKIQDEIHDQVQKIQTAPVDLKNFEDREKLTKLLVTQIEKQLDKEKIRLESWLVPPAHKSSYQAKANAGKVIYKTHARKSKSDTMFGAPKGGREPDDKTPLDTILREIQEEIGNLEPELLPKKENEFEEKASNGYTIFYKAIRHTDAEKIKKEIERRKQLHIGEMFYLEFRDIDQATSLVQNAFDKIKNKIQTVVTESEKAKIKAEHAQKKYQNTAKTLEQLREFKAVTGRPGASWGLKKKPSGGTRRLVKKRQTRKKKNKQ